MQTLRTSKGYVLVVLVWVVLWSAKCFSATEGYYLGWAEVAPVDRGIQVSFNPIDCNVCSFAVILPQENGVLVAHFDVSLVASDQLPEAQEGKIVARKAKLIRDGNIHECPDPPCLVLGAKGDLLRIDVSSNRSLKPSLGALFRAKVLKGSRDLIGIDLHTEASSRITEVR